VRENADFSTLIFCHGNTFEESKRGPDRSSMNKYLSFGAKIAKIGLVDPEIICLRVIIKKRKKLMPAKYIAWFASAPSGLNQLLVKNGKQF